MNIFEELRPLSDVLDLDGWPNDLLTADTADFLDRIIISTMRTAQTPLGTLFTASVVVEQGLTFRLSSLPFLSLVVAEATPDAPAIADLLLEQDWSLEVRDVPIALRLENSFLHPVNAGQAYPQFTIQGGIHFETGGISLIDYSASLSLPPCELGHTGILMEIGKLELILTEDDVPDIAFYYGYDESFRGIHAESASVTFLPKLRFGETNGLVIEGSELLIDRHGITCEVHIQFPLLDDGIHILPASEITGQLFGDNWPFALKTLDVDIVANLPSAFRATGALRIPVFDVLFDLAFGIAAATEDSGFHYTAAIQNRTPHHIATAYGTISYRDLSLEGRLGDATLTLQGIMSGLTINLPPLQLDTESAFVRITQDQQLKEVHLQLTDVELGPLGTIELAELSITDKEEGEQHERAVHLQAKLAWKDLQARLNLDPLPDHFPLPPDDALVTALLNWEDNGTGGHKLVLRFVAELSDLGSVWSFIPEGFRPEVRHVRFTFEASYANAAAFQNASSSDTFNGDAAVEMELRLPEFPAVPGAELFDVDREQWIRAGLKGGVRSVNGANEGYMEMAIANAPTVTVNFPGLPQTEPPIQITINHVDFDLKTQPGADSLTGHLSLDGDFLLRPINPAKTHLPVPPAMAAHMEKLFKAAGLSEFGGTATFDLTFKGDKAAVALGIAFDQAQLELDLFDMIAGLARGMAPPQGIQGSANSIDLDLDVDIRLRGIHIQLGSLEDSAPTDQSHVGFELALDATVAGVQVDGFSFKLSSQEFSFGFSGLAIPISLPHFPISLDDLNQLRDGTGAWEYETRWLQDREPQLTGSILQLKNEIETLKGQLTTATGDIEAALNKNLRVKRKALFEQSARKFLIESIFVVHQVVGPPNRQAYQALVEAYMTLMDATLHQFAFDTKLDLVLRDVRFVLPFQNPTDIRVEGGAQLAGFKPDDPMAPIGDVVFKLGLSAEYIYFNVEGGDPIALPVFGEYDNAAGEKEAKVSLRLNHARLGYGYSKNSLVVSFAGELKIAEPLADDLNTADVIGIGVRVPERSRVGFKLDLIPIVLGEVDFLLPLLEFDIDLRKEYSPGIADSATCAPFWDGLQLIAPNVIRQAFKRLRFSPFFGSLLAPNYNTSFDVMLGDAHNGLSYVCNEYLVIVPTSPYTIIPMLADGTPFFNNLCTNVRLGGFGVSFDLQRPFPSMSPLALFEIFGLLADPMLPIDSDGALANTIRATIQNARITLPPAVVRMFPEHGVMLARDVNYTINLGTLVTIAQAIVGPARKLLNQAQAATDAIGSVLKDIKNQPPDLSPASLLALLPPELRRFELHGSFVGFDATAVFVLLTPDDAATAFAERDTPTATRTPRLVVDERFDDPAHSGWDVVPPRARSTWQVEGGALRRSGLSDTASHVLYRNQYDDVSFTAVLAAEGHHAVGVVFGFQNEKNYYRFEMNPAAQVWELTKVRNAQVTVLRQRQQTTQLRHNYTVAVKSDGTAVLPLGGPARAGVRLVVTVDGRDEFDFHDASNPFKEGRLGVTCQAGAAVRFESLRIHRLGTPRPPRQGEYPDPAWLTSYQPNFAKPAVPLYDPTDAAQSPLKSAPFDAFDGDSLAALPVPSTTASGVLVGAEVNVLNDQRVGFMGYLYTDGTFGLISALDVAPLRLSVAGIAMDLPLQVYGRLMLEGRAHGAQSYSKVRAQVWGAWQPLPGIVELDVGSKTTPIELTLDSNGRFSLKGSGVVTLFGGAALLTGAVDVSHTHCRVTGAFDYKPDFKIGNHSLIELSLASTGRIGPANAFELSGAGTLKILGKSFSQIRGSVSNKGVDLEARLDGGAWNWSGIDIKQCTLALKGTIDPGKSGAPAFLLEGEAKVRLFGTPTSKARMELSGRGGIRAEAGVITQFIEGSLYWQGRQWLGGRLELGTQQISVQGRTAFALDLTPGDLPAGIQVANLYFRVELSGEFTLSATGGLKACSLDIDWALAAEMPGMDQQFPIAMQKKRVSYASGANGIQSEIELLPLVAIDGALFVPFDHLTLPVPVITADQHTQYYWYWDNVTPVTKPTYQKVNIKNSGATTDPRFPTGIEQDQLLFSIPNPNPTGTPFRVFNYKLGNWKYLTFTDDQIALPTIKAPRVTASVPSSVPANEKFALFNLPTHFNASFSDGQVNLLTNLQFTLTLAWEDGKLGVTVKKGNVKKFTPFDRMFG
jgi:hypothetical protein